MPSAPSNHSPPTPHGVSLPCCFRQALDIAHRQQAKSLELCTAMSLGHLRQRQGKCEAACELLAPIYGLFTEGFNTADLQEAKGLFKALS